MDDAERDMGLELMLDGNAVAGLLQEVFGAEMTGNPARCAHCGRLSKLGELLAFGLPLGTVLRCPACRQVVMRMVEQPDAVLLEMQGTSYLRFERDPI
jgi:hypothetical protein